MSEIATTAPSFDPQIAAIGDQMAKLKSSEATELLAYLKDTYKIEPVGGGVSNDATTGPIIIVEEATNFDVILKAVDPAKKVNVIKAVREATGLGLKESKEAVEGAPKTIKDALPKAEAEALKKKLEEAGGTVELK